MSAKYDEMTPEAQLEEARGRWNRTKTKSMQLPKRHLDADVWSLALERTERIYSLHDHVAVAFSGGKDSTAILHVALEVAEALDRLPLRVIHYDEEAIPYETEAYVRRVGERDDVELEWYCVPLRENNACSRESPFWYPWAPEDEAKWVRPKPPEGIDLEGFPVEPAEARLAHLEANAYLFPIELGQACLLMGIRASESLTRHRAVTRRPRDNYIIKHHDGPHHGNIWKGYPIYDWQTEDVWTAPGRFGWDYNAAYDLMAMAGLTPTQQRCAPPFGTEPMGKLWTFATCFPEVWERMIDRVPGAAAAARYSNTELYAHGSVPEKPAGVRWGEYLRSFLDQHEGANYSNTRRLILKELRRHFYKTEDPLVAHAPHPISGLCWDHLLLIAMRGDPRSRRQASMKMSAVPEQIAKARVEYEAERETYAGREEELKP